MEQNKERTRRQEEIERIIADTAKQTASEVVRQQNIVNQTNLYRVMERLLRSYKALQKIVCNPDEYGFLPPARSKSITVAPPSGGGLRDYDEALEDILKARHTSFERTVARYDEIDNVVRLYEDRPEFIVIRMYYFGEDADGNERPAESKYYSFEEISEALNARGIQRSEKTLRKWRTALVQEMTVTLFGIDGALSVENRDARRQE